MGWGLAGEGLKAATKRSSTERKGKRKHAATRLKPLQFSLVSALTLIFKRLITPQTCLMGTHNRFRTIGDLQFDEDIGDMVLHRFEAHAQRMCNRGIVQSS